jgi:Ca2+-binding RTX toxin-like protein
MSDKDKLKDDEMTDEELKGIAAAGVAFGTDGRDTLKGGAGNDLLIGNDGDDRLYGSGGDDTLLGGEGRDKLMGGSGSDLLSGGAGNDYMDGGYRDGANDVALGGFGDDYYVWGTTRDGSDVFDGGQGKDTLVLEMSGTRTSVQGALESGHMTLSIEGDPDFTPSFDSKGNLVLPEGSSGTITGPNGDTLTFTNVEMIRTY